MVVQGSSDNRLMNSYLQIAEAVLKKTRQPLSAREILEAAYRLQVVPSHLFGKTQHKTLHARLSEELGTKQRDPMFVRTGPGRFQLRATSPCQPNPTPDYVAPLRSYQLKHFDVICAEKRKVSALWDSPKISVSFAQIASAFSKQMPLRAAEANTSITYLSVFVTISFADKVLTLTKLGASVLRTLGLSGHVKGDDANLFATEPFGIDHAARRTIAEQSTATLQQIDELVTLAAFEKLQCLRSSEVPDGPEVGDAILLLTNYRCDDPDGFLHHFPSYRTPRWSRVPCEINDIDGLEPISRWLIAHLAPVLSASTASNCINNLVDRKAL